MLPSIEIRLAKELAAHTRQVESAIALLDEGATVPFIARYRKEATGGLDDTQLRLLAERLVYLRELEARREAVLLSIDEQGKLGDALRGDILLAETKQRLEDLYLPYKPKRRTKAQIAREAGLAPLADALLANPDLDPEGEALAYLNAEAGFADTKAVLDGARQILIEQMAEDAELVGTVRTYFSEHAIVRATVIAGKESEGAKFLDYFDFSETLATVPSHRALAVLRGRNEGILSLTLPLDSDIPSETAGNPPSDPLAPNPCEIRIANRYGIRDKGRAADKWLRETVRWCWRVKLALHLELELMNALRERAEEEAIRVFGRNLKDLLLSAPAGQRPTLGLDPGLRTGVKVAAVDATGKLLATDTIYPHQPRRDIEGSINCLAALARQHAIELVAIGNGTGSRETEQLVATLIERHPELRLTKVLVSEAGASVYSASESAAREFPGLDVSLRGAVSIARRLQDPLAELVKIEPKAIGVGQYQHDVSQVRLARALDGVVEDCVNAVGVDLNTASIPLLTRVSGLNSTLAGHIVAWRDEHGAFTDRQDLRKVHRLGDKTFEQAAGFLRIAGGKNPLDASAVHPEAYPLAKHILVDCGKHIRDLLGDLSTLRGIDAQRYVDDRFGLPTVQDILKELEKPGRDPRPAFKTASFREGIEDLKDLSPGMILEGVVTNVANFGAFVDIGVHQDGLVHISALANHFVKDPHAVVKAGQIVKVKVLAVDLPRKRVSLTMRMDDEPERAADSAPPPRRSGKQSTARDPKAASPASGAMAEAFAKLRR